LTNFFTLHHGDCLDVMRTLPDASVDAVVTDPPYGLSFMGKRWDYDVPSVDVWRECLRVLKPGGHLLAFAGTRTQHRMAVRIEDAGFEIRDMIAWVYGCLSEDTEILIDGKWEHYSKAIAGSRVLCYDNKHGTLEWNEVEDTYEYQYNDTAYRIVSDSTDQIVSRNHRCIIERCGEYVFEYAEQAARQPKARVPVLENMPALLDALPVRDERSGSEKHVLQPSVRGESAKTEKANRTTQGENGPVRELRNGSMATGSVAEKEPEHVLLEVVQGKGGDRPDIDGEQVRQNGDEVSRGRVEGREKPSMEGRRDVLPQARELQASQVRSVPEGVPEHGAERRLRYGASFDSSAGVREGADPDGSSAPRKSRPAGQPDREPSAIRKQPRPQTVRASRYSRPDMALIEPIHYDGVVWCVKVPTGAFVARRNGKVFITGNSGFPKSHNVSKAIDKAAGAEREVVGSALGARNGNGQNNDYGSFGSAADGVYSITAPATPEAQQWAGWGTALKPALEPITLARKPLEGTVAANVLAHGCGGLNVDGCRIETEGEVLSTPKSDPHKRGAGAGEYAISTRNTERMHAAQAASIERTNTPGRWPANFTHDGSEEVVGLLGEAARLFYCPKASKRDRDEGCEGLEEVRRSDGRKTEHHVPNLRTTSRRNYHPTVKPTALMRWLCRLITPPGGVVLDPFTGSGSTGKAAMLEGFEFIGIEREAEYVEIARARIEHAAQTPAQVRLPLGGAEP
jgi:DNA modification methylase